jgi:hypothetical protein
MVLCAILTAEPQAMAVHVVCNKHQVTQLVPTSFT